jgi:hypothetical protein
LTYYRNIVRRSSLLFPFSFTVLFPSRLLPLPWLSSSDDQTDSSGGCEPCTFFQVLEVYIPSPALSPLTLAPSLSQFLIFDENKKGYIIEDDCMEILFARYGRSVLSLPHSTPLPPYSPPPVPPLVAQS